MKDVGIIDIDSYGFIYRWWPHDRSNLSDYFRSGPGWVPEHYVSYVKNYEDGGYIHPKHLIHVDKIRTNNNPDNLRIPIGFKEPCNPEVELFATSEALPEYEYVYCGHLQQTTRPIVKISRCIVCGLPTFDKYIHCEDEIEVCQDCFWEHLEFWEEWDYWKRKDPTRLREVLELVDPTDSVENNIKRDHSRGYTTPQLIEKYKDYTVRVEDIIPYNNPVGDFSIVPLTPMSISQIYATSGSPINLQNRISLRG